METRTSFQSLASYKLPFSSLCYFPSLKDQAKVDCAAKKYVWAVSMEAGGQRGHLESSLLEVLVGLLEETVRRTFGLESET